MRYKVIWQVLRESGWETKNTVFTHVHAKHLENLRETAEFYKSIGYTVKEVTLDDGTIRMIWTSLHERQIRELSDE